jgi:RNA polymerase sigma-70 factor, ECF subfamily
VKALTEPGRQPSAEPNGENGTRRQVYCVVPADLAPQLHDYLRDHWRDDPSMTVVVERRGKERRQHDRRSEGGAAPKEERRRIRTPRGRRVADRRAMAMTIESPPLPQRARRHAEELVFVERFQPVKTVSEDIETNRLVVRAQAGELSAFEDIYLRYFDRVYSYARVALRDRAEAEDVAQNVFANALEALPRYEVRADKPFRAWLFRITRNTVLQTLRRGKRLQLEEPAELERRLERPIPQPWEGLDWLSDSDLATLVERLPMSQRQVILMRYVFELRTDEIAEAIEKTPVAVRMLQHRAMRALESRLGAMAGRPRRQGPSPIRRRASRLPVLGQRRFMLEGQNVSPLRTSPVLTYRRAV